MARALASLPQKPKRPALFLAVTAEEGGLKGSEYYAAHMLIPPAKTALDLNYDALYPWSRAKDVVITGAERTSVFPLAQQIARRLTLEISPDDTPEAGHYFRSDHFSFAHAGIPAFSIEHATEFAGKPAGFGAQAYQEYNSKHYHQPSGAGGGLRLPAGPRRGQPGQAARLAGGRPVPPVGATGIV
jgi:Zn-dependent M28 family amino/carboxypeptidase